MGHCCSKYPRQLRSSAAANAQEILQVDGLTNRRSLPPELLLLIFEEIYRRPYPTRCARLRAAALVCRAWLNPAQQLLWRSIEVQSYHQLNSLCNTCAADARGAALATNVHILSIWNSSGFMTIQGVTKLFQHLSRVVELRVNNLAPKLPLSDIDDLELATIRRPGVPQLVVLRISQTYPALVHTILHTIPTLRFVEVRGCRPAALDVGTASDQTSPPHPRCKLYELRWGVDSDLHAPHALRASFDTLRILTLHSLPPADALPTSLLSRLRSLSVYNYDHALPYAVRRCGALEEFIMESHVPTAALLSALPHSLEHLAFSCGYYSEHAGLEAVAAWLRGGDHMNLRVVTCFSPDTSATDWDDFVHACRSTHTELRCFDRYGSEHEYEALGEVVCFPRPGPYHAQQIQV